MITRIASKLSKRYQIQTSFPKTHSFYQKKGIKRYFSNEDKGPKLKKIELPAEFQEGLKDSYIFKIMQFYQKCKSNRTSAASELMKVFLLFKEYIFPNPTRDPYFFKIIKTSYYYLIFSKLTTSLMSLTMKFGVNMISQPNFDVYKCFAVFSMYPALNLISSFYEGKRTLHHSKVTQSAITKISMEAYRKILQLDWIVQYQGLTMEVFNLEKVRNSIERNLNMFHSVMIPIFCELMISCSMILIYCGPIYMFNLCLTMYLYIRFTIIHSMKRKSFIKKQHQLDKQSNFVISG